MIQAEEAEVLCLTERLLQAIAVRDWQTYAQLCDPTLTCFEPEARGHMVQGMSFHRFYFELESGGPAGNTTICSPHVRIMGAVAVVSYVRLVQSTGSNGGATTSATQETRVWERQPGGWRLVHLHRSMNS